MENKNIQIAEAGLAMFLKFGIRRTTMNDIARAAGVTRQTLYNSFENKDAVLKHAVSFYCDRQLQQVRDECETATELEQKLRICLTHFVTDSWRMMQEFPESEELETGSLAPVQSVLAEAVIHKTEFMTDLLAEYNQHDAGAMAPMLVASMAGLKSMARSSDELSQMQEAFIKLVIAWVKGGG